MSVLCDRATTRDNLLHVLGAGITQVALGAVPGPLDLDLALLFRAEGPQDVEGQHTVTARLLDSSGTQLVEAGFTWELSVAANPDTDDPPPPHVPVAVPFHQIPIPALGRYEIHVALDDTPVDVLSVLVHQDRAALVPQT